MASQRERCDVGGVSAATRQRTRNGASTLMPISARRSTQPTVTLARMETERQQRYRHEAGLLGEIGALLAKVDLPSTEVRLPRAVAEQALAAWQRDADERPLDPETYEQGMRRRRAATLSLIGLSIETAGRWDNDHVTVELHPQLIGEALEAADELSS